MNTITWLHLSDLHVCGEDPADRDDFDNILADIRITRSKRALNPDAIFFTGDVAFSGQKEQYDLACKWFDDILDACGLPGQRDRLFVVPGNHDINREVVQRTKLTLSHHESLAETLLRSDSYDMVEEFLKSEPDREWVFAKFHNFAQFIGEFFNDEEMEFNHNRYYSVRCLETHQVVVLGLNSAWLSFRDNEQGQLLLGEKQVCDALREARDGWPDARLCLAMVHHPLYWLAEKDIHKLQQHLPGRCDVLLQGHLHYSGFSVQSTPDAYIHAFAAGASLGANYHAYNIVQLNLDTGEGIAVVRLQHNDIGKNWGHDTLTYRHAQNGEIKFSLKLGEGHWASGEPAAEV